MGVDLILWNCVGSRSYDLDQQKSGVVVEWVGAWASSSPAPYKYFDVPHSTRELRSGEGIVTEEKRKKTKIILCTPGADGPGWYRQLREPISPLSLLNCDQLWQIFSRGWTILLRTVIYDLDSRITAKCSKYQSSFYSMQVSFRFHSLRCSEILVSPSDCTKIRTWRFHRTEEVSNIFSVSWHITHISMTISANLGRDTDHNSTKLVCDYPFLWPLMDVSWFTVCSVAV